MRDQVLGTIVETASGRFQGYHDGQSLFFGGIPYTAGPEGAHRFRPPEPPELLADPRAELRAHWASRA